MKKIKTKMEERRGEAVAAPPPHQEESDEERGQRIEIGRNARLLTTWPLISGEPETLLYNAPAKHKLASPRQASKKVSDTSTTRTDSSFTNIYSLIPFEGHAKASVRFSALV